MQDQNNQKLVNMYSKWFREFGVLSIGYYLYLIVQSTYLPSEDYQWFN